MSAPTKEIVTRGGHKVVIKEYLTARDERTITAAITDRIQISVDTETKKAKVGDIPASVAAALEDATLTAMLVSVDGKTEGLLDAVLDLPVDDFNDITAAIESVKKTLEKKTEKPLSTTPEPTPKVEA